MAEYYVGTLDELSETTPTLLQAGDTLVGVFRVGSRVYAFANRCPHMGGPVCQGEVLPKLEERLNDAREIVAEQWSDETFLLTCPWHGWEFDVASGRCHVDPAFRLTAYETRVEGRDVYLLA